MRGRSVIVRGLALTAVTALTALLAGCGQSSGAGSPPSDRTAPGVSRSSDSPATAPSPAGSAVDSDAGLALIDHVRWGSTSKGRQLQVFPTPAGRTDRDPSAAARAWAEILSDAPNAGTAGMYDQFLCHWNYARVVEPDKPSWDLEPWRPAVGYRATVAALCNPGGSEG
jgi:hypothetical protein